MTNGQEFPVAPAGWRERKTLTYLPGSAPRTWPQIQDDEAARAKADAERKAKEEAEKLKLIAEDEAFQERKREAESQRSKKAA